MKFFERKWRLVVGDATAVKESSPLARLPANALELSEFDCEFKAKKTLTPLQPNSLKLRIYNLTPSHRKLFESGRLRVIFDAGYKDDTVQVFNGQVRSAYSMKEGNNWITYLDTGDSFMEVALAQINTSMGPATPLGQIIQKVAGSLGVKPGNMNLMLAKLGGKLQAATGSRTILKGSSAKILTDLCDTAGLEWSVQNGELQLLEKGQPLEDGTGVLLTPDTGQIESPSLELKSAGSFSSPVQIAKSIALSKPGHLVKATTLLHPGLRVGGKVQFETSEVRGGYRILELEYEGNTRGKEWYTKLTGSRYTQGTVSPNDPGF